ncbi:TetR family transcriptional regulator [Nakamurella sp.]|uniref:TetR/AcrR family transcriptional regulator n=1 Tax=Nakamurella sp. TaxID=1869182 RepID=UPI003B3B5C2A
MSSVHSPAADLTARARIRDSAIVYIGRHGWRAATVRAIATDAGVSAALVIHHFGSKDGLREACDAHVTGLIDELSRQAAENLGVGDTLDLINAAPHLAPLTPYVVRTIGDGGEFAQRLWDRLVDDTERYLRAAVAGGVARPTDDERVRAELLVIFKLGTYQLARYALPPANGARPDDLDLAAITDRYGVPALELFTHGLYRTSDYLDAFRARRPAPDPAPDPTTDPATDPATAESRQRS